MLQHQVQSLYSHNFWFKVSSSFPPIFPQVFLDVRRNNFTAEVRRLISGSADLGRSCGLKWVSEEEQMQKGTLRKPANFQLKKRAKEV